jgi:hypothetical protein
MVYNSSPFFRRYLELWTGTVAGEALSADREMFSRLILLRQVDDRQPCKNSCGQFLYHSGGTGSGSEITGVDADAMGCKAE